MEDPVEKSPGICMMPSLWRRAKQSNADLDVAKWWPKTLKSCRRWGFVIVSGGIQMEFVGSHFAECQMIWDT